MAGKLEWLFSLIDKTSGPARAIEQKLEILEKRLKAVDKAAKESKDPRSQERLGFRKMELELQRDGLLMKRTSETTEGWITLLNHALGVVGMIGGALSAAGNFAAGLAGSAGRIAFSFGKAAVEAASYKETNLISLGVMTGSEEKARRMLKWAVDFAATTPFETKETLGWQKRLFAAGFNEQELPVLLKAVGDVGAMNDFSRELIERTIHGFSRVRAEGRLTLETLEPFMNASVNAERVYARIGNIYGIKDVEQVKRMREHGQIGSDVAIRAIVEEIRDSISGGQLGLLMDRLSGTIPGLMSTLLSRPFEFMMDLDESKGFGYVKRALVNLLAAVDHSADRIKGRLRDIFDTLTGGLFRDLAGTDGLQSAEELIGKILAGVDQLAIAGKGAFAFLTGVGGGFLGAELESLRKVFDGPLTEEKLARLTEAGQELGKALSGVVDVLTRFGRTLGDEGWGRAAGGMVNHVAEVKKHPFTAGVLMAPAYAASDLFNITAAVGGSILGKASGEVASNGMRPATGILAQVNPLGGAGGAFGVKVQAPVQINVDARGATPEAVPLIAQEVKNAAEQAMTSTFEAYLLGEASWMSPVLK